MRRDALWRDVRTRPPTPPHHHFDFTTVSFFSLDGNMNYEMHIIYILISTALIFQRCRVRLYWEHAAAGFIEAVLPLLARSLHSLYLISLSLSLSIAPFIISVYHPSAVAVSYFSPFTPQALYCSSSSAVCAHGDCVGVCSTT